jgi:hypothetical protein
MKSVSDVVLSRLVHGLPSTTAGAKHTASPVLLE